MGSRWPKELVTERWDAMTHDDREALLRYGHRQAPYESVPVAARRILLCDHRVTLEGVRVIDAVFRTAYTELADPLGGTDG